MYNIPTEMTLEEFNSAMTEANEHFLLTDVVNLIYRHGLHKLLLSLADHCEDGLSTYALAELAKIYKENELDFCKDAPTMQ